MNCPIGPTGKLGEPGKCKLCGEHFDVLTYYHIGLHGYDDLNKFIENILDNIKDGNIFFIIFILPFKSSLFMIIIILFTENDSTGLTFVLKAIFCSFIF